MKVLLVRLDHAGDVVLTVPPAAARLRSAMPDAQIHVLTTNTGESLLRNDANIDQIIAWDAPWSVPPPGMRHVPRLTFARRLMQFLGLMLRRKLVRYDAVVYLSFSPWERILTRPLARRRIGFCGPYTRKAHVASERLLTDRLAFDEAKHITENCQDLLNLLSEAGDRTAPRLELDHATLAASASQLRTTTGTDSNVVLIHPGSPRSFKSWPHSHFVQLAEEIAERTDAMVVIASSAGEQAQFGDEFGFSSHPRVRYLVTSDLRQFAALAVNAQLVIANDGGPCHIAAAVGSPLLAIFGPTSEAIYGPVGPYVRVVRQPHPSAPCSMPWRVKRPCCGGIACLRDLKPEDVWPVALSMLAESSHDEVTVPAADVGVPK